MSKLALFKRVCCGLLSRILIKAGKKLESLMLDKNYLAWIRNNGDKTLRLDYNLNSASVVFDVGGYEGQWTSDIYAKYNSNIYIFEPVSFFFEKIKSRFKMNNKIKVFPFGLAAKNEEIPISLSRDGSSFLLKTKHTEVSKLIKFSDFYNEQKLEHIDLIKINIEGGEYDLLEDIIESGLIQKIDNLQIQFHNFFKESTNKMEALQRKLEITHRLTYQYVFIWENWQKKTVNS